MSVEQGDDFQKELVELFVQEAHEWLQNIHVALDELQQGPAPDRHQKLVEIISAGVSNLGGSAATINLPDVEQASFAALPFIDAIRDPQKTVSVQDFLSLCKQLGQIHAALTKTTGVSFEETGEATAESVRQTMPIPDFVRALQQIQHTQKLTGRNLVQGLIDQMESQLRAGIDQVDVCALHDFLGRVSDAEEAFLRTVQQSLPALADKVRSLAMDGSQQQPGKEVLEASLRDVSQLRADAQQVNAAPVMIFLTGLQSLLSVIIQRRVTLAANRLVAVEGRVRSMAGIIQQWVELGQAERAAINKLLPNTH
jgi:chemotaxis protein histidine kinase CheA